MIDERRMNNVGTNTLDVVVEPNGDRLRTSTVEVNAHTSIPILDVLLPSGHGDHVKIPHVNLSITGYEPDSWIHGWTGVSSNERPYWKMNTGNL